MRQRIEPAVERVPCHAMAMFTAAVSQDVRQKRTGQHNLSDQAGPRKATEDGSQRNTAIGFLIYPGFCDFLGKIGAGAL